MVHTVELNWGKPLYHIPPPSPMSQDAVCRMLCLYIYAVTKYVNVLNFRPENSVSGPLRPKGPELEVVIMNLRWPSVSVIRKY